MYGYIYFTKNLINNKKYIGQHKETFTNNYLGSGKLIIQAIKKYGKENFKISLWEYCDSLEKLNDQEEYYIEKYNAVKDKMYYNLRYGGNQPKHSEESKIKNSKSNKGKKRHTRESKKRLSKRWMGSNNPMFGKTGKDNPNFGSKRSDETRRKLSIIQQNRQYNKVNCSYCPMTGNKRIMMRWHFDNCKFKHIDYDTYIKDKEQSRIHKITKCPYCCKEGSVSNMKRWHFNNCKHK